MDMLDKIIAISNNMEQEIIDIRRKIHANPELGFEEFETSKLICSYLDSLGVEYIRNVAGTGVVATIKGNNHGKTIMLRADMDALPLDEETGLDFQSKIKGKMHACGHDVHVSNLLGVVALLNNCRELINGKIKFLFQPAEESGGGGREVVKEGILKDVDMALGFHVDPEKEGSIMINKGYTTAYSDGFQIKVLGKNAHSSKPQEGVDAIYIATNILNALYSLNFRSLDPFDTSTFTIGIIEGGTATNIIPREVKLKGMLRSIEPSSREIVREKLESISKGIAKTLGGEVEFSFSEGYPSVYNDENLVDLAVDTLKSHYGKILQDVTGDLSKGEIDALIKMGGRPKLGAEDFGFYAQKVPSLFLWIGTGDIAPLHSKDFTVNESYIKIMTRTMSYLAIKFLENLGGKK